MTLLRYSVFAAMLASAGLPIYLHAPKVYADEYGVSLGQLGLLLFALRLIDFIQDPALGWLAGRLKQKRALAALIGSTGLMIGMVCLFAIQPPIAPLVWMALCLVTLFTSYSFLSILFYARGIGQAQTMGQNGHVRLAAWREIGALIGISFASTAPTLLLLNGFAAPYAVFAGIFVGLAILASAAMHQNWPGTLDVQQTGFRVILSDPKSRLLLLIGLANAAPVAITGTLFLFFVEYRLGDATFAGPLLLIFFAAAAFGAALFTAAARRFGTVRMLGVGMALSIVAFSFAYSLGAGDFTAFTIVCIASGLALGADMALLPALFAQRIADLSGNGGEAFGLWNFCAKFAFALGAMALPALEAGGFQTGTQNTPEALARLSLLYALVPCILKLFALSLLPLLSSTERKPA